MWSSPWLCDIVAFLSPNTQSSWPLHMVIHGYGTKLQLFLLTGRQHYGWQLYTHCNIFVMWISMFFGKRYGVPIDHVSSLIITLIIPYMITISKAHIHTLECHNGSVVHILDHNNKNNSISKRFIPQSFHSCTIWLFLLSRTPLWHFPFQSIPLE